jgi:hypothetical protein
MKQLLLIVTTAALLLLYASQLFASPICVPSELKVKVLRGRVISVPIAKGQEPMANALVELRERKYKRNGALVERTLKRVVTDENGGFDLGRIKSGKYLIYARWTVEELRTDFTFPVLIDYMRQSDNSEPELIITLGFSFADEGCHGSFAKYGNQNTMD